MDFWIYSRQNVETSIFFSASNCRDLKFGLMSLSYFKIKQWLYQYLIDSSEEKVQKIFLQEIPILSKGIDLLTDAQKQEFLIIHTAWL